MWKTHQSKHQKKQKQHEESPFAHTKNLPVEACHIVFLQDPATKASPKPDQEFMAAIDNCLWFKNAPQCHRIAKVTRNIKGMITATTIPGVDATMLLRLYCNVSRISDDILLGAIAASLGIWITGVTITICYLVIRN
jgi:hypothetical protein